MELSPLVWQWRQEALQAGRTLCHGENLLRIHFGELDDQLMAIVEPLLKLSSEEFTRLLLQSSNLSREDLLLLSVNTNGRFSQVKKTPKKSATRNRTA